MMKKFIGLLLLAVIVAGARAEDVISEAPAPYTERGVSITKYVDGASTLWTNNASEPWYISSVWSDNDGATNTITVSVGRVYDIRFQVQPDTVETNFFGQVVTNSFNQVTNILTRVFTNDVVSATVTGASQIDVSGVFMIKGNDVIKITQTHTNTGKPVVINGQR